MGRDAFEASAAARAVFEAADEATGLPLRRLCFEGPAEDLRRTELQQPAILTTSIALLRALQEQVPVEPACLLGHSLGEYTALVAAGSLGLEDGVALVHARGRFMQECVAEGRGAMAALLGLDLAAVTELCGEEVRRSGAVVAPANLNGPRQIVIAGETQAVEAILEAARERGARRAVRLAVSAPFHCSLMQPAAEKLAAELARIRFEDPRVPVVSNVDAQPNRAGERVARLLEAQVTAPVRFNDCVQRLGELGVRRVLEVGPGRVLSGLVARIDRKLQRAAVSTMEEARAWAEAAARR